MKKTELYLFVIFAVFLLPLFISPKTIDPGLFPRFLLLALFISIIELVTIIRISRSRFTVKQTIHIGTLHFFLGGYLIFMLISLSKAINIAEAIFEALKVALFCIYIAIAFKIINRSEKDRLTVIKSIVITSLLVSILGIIEYWGIFTLIECARPPASTMVNRNLLSSFLFLCLGFVLFGIYRFNGIWYFISVFANSLIFYVFLITQTRAVWAACIIGIIVTCGISLFVNIDKVIGNVKQYWKRVLLMVAAVIGIAFFHQLLRPEGDRKPEINDSLASISDTNFKSNRQRMILWKKTAIMIKENVLFGVGGGNWKIRMPKYNITGLDSQDMTTIYVRPHNDFLWVFAETGIFGFLSFIGIFVVSFFYAVRVLRNNKNRSYGLLSVCLLFITIGYAIVSALDFPKERFPHLVYWGTVLAFLISLNSSSIKKIKLPGQMSIIIHCSILLISLVALWVGYIRVNGDIHMAKVFWARQGSRWEFLIKEVDSINTTFYSVDHTSTPVHWYRGVANFSLNRIKEALNDFKEAFWIHPYHIHVLNNLASSYESLGEHSQAENYYLKALEISPGFDEALVNLAAVYYNINDYKRAYETIIRTNPSCRDHRRESYLKAIKEKYQPDN